jgi:hypothetical protein
MTILQLSERAARLINDGATPAEAATSVIEEGLDELSQDMLEFHFNDVETTTLFFEERLKQLQQLGEFEIGCLTMKILDKKVGS